MPVASILLPSVIIMPPFRRPTAVRCTEVGVWAVASPCREDQYIGLRGKTSAQAFNFIRSASCTRLISACVACVVPNTAKPVKELAASCAVGRFGTLRQRAGFRLELFLSYIRNASTCFALFLVEMPVGPLTNGPERHEFSGANTLLRVMNLRAVGHGVTARTRQRRVFVTYFTRSHCTRPFVCPYDREVAIFSEQRSERVHTKIIIRVDAETINILR